MKKFIILSALMSLFLTSCDEEFLDPTRASEEDVFSSRDGLVGVANGLQSRFSVGRQSPFGYAIITANGFTTNELGAPQGGNADEVALFAGSGEVLPVNGVVSTIWAQSLILNSEAQKVINNIDRISLPVEKASVLVHASIFKALALGNLIQFFERVPISTEKNAVFNSRAEVLAVVIKTLEDTKTSLPSATGFSGLVGNLNYTNTVNALLARFYLMSGSANDLDKALEHATLVNLSVRSNFPFDAVNQNSIAATAFLVANNYQPIGRTLGLPAALQPVTADGRINFYINPISTPSAVKGAGFWSGVGSSVPVYLPGEMILIRAEVLARKNQLPQAIIEINRILQKTAASDAWGVGANLPAYSGAADQASVLTEIYRNRCIELFMSGLKLEDTRRFNRPASGTVGAERNRNWYPYPDSERFNNTNTPADPAN
ncbi:RagB/SusD family nutrient uptake outer membrane protein [Flavobacterium sp. GSP27]|uniref:RagB/SusD family nutrient uptake outer membrane protein n=1 Tax=unclassified Flavobacterium TaxID=196869 RepID=UPI000F839121|nr:MULTISPECIES: RagB/SusD family nutrient uptake outer membrane protein [unclassified Flavobacterium]RTY84760.1 RagB/SusD family nutrient uptake outer membrane protein [Flavobacterium sp. ZB4P23]RTY94037.1 RagB/SusD family nutrient uptake outer membrane protein [Flavobacterium sp. GSN2]RTZ05896.1 RagB/SusD family nutrient uptake outer membrane protein [Flavobacterium sp. GSP27]